MSSWARVLFFAHALFAPVMAQAHGAVSAAAAASGVIAANSSAHQQQLRDFRAFLRQNPLIANALQADPAQVKDPAFRAAHPELKQYLNSHPNFANWFQHQPRTVMNGVEQGKH